MTYTEIVILTVLMNQDRHGYDIKKVAENLFGESMTINNNTLYTCLHKFEKMGAVSSRIEHMEGKPDRHVYRMTDRGKEIFRELIRDYSPEIASSDYEFYARVAFFDMIEPGECLEILKIRKTALTGYIERLSRIYHGQSEDRSYNGKMVRFIEEQANNEITWIRSLEAELKEKA